MKSNVKGSFEKRITPYLYILPTKLLMLVLIAVPIAMVIGYTFFDNVIINPYPVFVGLRNYITLLSDSAFWVALRNTGVFVGFSVLFHMILGIAFAMLLNSSYLGKVTKAIFRLTYVLPWLFTASVIAILWRVMLHPMGIVNYLVYFFNLYDGRLEWFGSRDHALFAVTLMNIWAGYPFFMISILAGLQGISTDLYEASAIDGANVVQQFFRITIPQLKPILLSLLMLDFVWTTHQFALIWMTTGGGPIDATEVLSTYIFKEAFSRHEYALASTGAVINLIICTLVAIFYVRHQKARD